MIDNGKILKDLCTLKKVELKIMQQLGDNIFICTFKIT